MDFHLHSSCFVECSLLSMLDVVVDVCRRCCCCCCCMLLLYHHVTVETWISIGTHVLLNVVCYLCLMLLLLMSGLGVMDRPRQGMRKESQNVRPSWGKKETDFLGNWRKKRPKKNFGVRKERTTPQRHTHTHTHTHHPLREHI